MNIWRTSARTCREAVGNEGEQQTKGGEKRPLELSGEMRPICSGLLHARFLCLAFLPPSVLSPSPPSRDPGLQLAGQLEHGGGKGDSWLSCNGRGRCDPRRQRARTLMFSAGARASLTEQDSLFTISFFYHQLLQFSSYTRYFFTYWHSPPIEIGERQRHFSAIYYHGVTRLSFRFTGLRGRLRGPSRGGRRPGGRRRAVSRGERRGVGDRGGLGGPERGREPRQHQQLGRQEGQAAAHHHRPLQREPQPPSGMSCGHSRLGFRRNFWKFGPTF